MNEQDREQLPEAPCAEGVEAPETPEAWAVEPVGAPEEFGFPEKPTIAERKRWAAQERFLAEYARTGLLCHSADVAGVTPQAVEQWRKDVTTRGKALNGFQFEKRLEVALRRYNERLDAEIDRRALEGVDKPVTYKGQITGTFKEYSDNLLMFKKKKLDPSYRDNYNVQVDARQYVTSIVINPPPGYSDPPQVIEGQSRELP